MTKYGAVNVPQDVLDAVDGLVASGHFPSRSAAVRAGMVMLVEATRRAAIDRAFTEGFRRVPETANELAEAERLAVGAIADEPWGKWW